MLTASQLLGQAATWPTILKELLIDAIAEGINVTAWGKGQPTITVYIGVSKFFGQFSPQIKAIADQGFLFFARGDALTLLAEQVYGVKRRLATFATTTIYISNPGNTNNIFDPGELIVVNTAAQVQYVNISSDPIVVGPLAVSVPVAVRALTAGSAGNALANQIDAFETPIAGLTLSQTTPALADDEQSDEELRTACQARVGYVPTASTIGAGGASGAYESVARSGPDGKGGVLRADGTRIAVTRARVLDGPPVTVVVADADGPITSPDLILVDAAIKAYAVPHGVTPMPGAANAVALALSISYQIWIPASSTATNAEIQLACNAAIADLMATVPIGGWEIGAGNGLPNDTIVGAVRDAAQQYQNPIRVLVSVASYLGSLIPLAEDEVPTLAGPTIGLITRVNNA